MTHRSARRSTLWRAKRRLDRAFYRLLVRLYRALFPSRAPRGRIPTASVHRVLVVRHDAIGDMAVTLPAIAYLRDALPAAEIDVVASPRNASLLDWDERVRRVYVHDHSWRSTLKLVRALRGRRYDAIVSPLLRHGLREGLLAALASVDHTARISPWRQARYLGLFTHPCRTHASERNMATRLVAVVQRAIGDGAPPSRVDADAFPAALASNPAADARVAAFLDSHAVRSFVALNAWAAESHRLLGAALATDLAIGIAQRGVDVVLTPPPDAVAEAESIAAAARTHLAPLAPTRIVVAPRGTLHHLIAFLRRAAIVVTPDTANVHLASALGTPVVSLHTPIGTDVRDWGPWGVPNQTVVLSSPRALSTVQADEVLAAFDSLAAAVQQRFR